MEGGTKGKRLWIKNAVRHKGKLHEELGVPEGKKIPERKIKKAERSKNPTLRREAVLAETLEKIQKKAKKKGKEKEAKKKAKDTKKSLKTVKIPKQNKKQPAEKTPKKKTTKAKKK